ncbi:MAG: sugar-transfer associated ATP-grasp domain-containing protein, partial [Acetobacteraceae bacterium]
ALWSVRAIVLLTPKGAVLHRAVAKIATGENPADNFWRSGNMLGAVDLATGSLGRVVSGTSAAMAVNPVHPGTGRIVVGTPISDWSQIKSLVTAAAQVLQGIRTQSWDVAVTDRGPVLLEVNFGGDLNLAQLAHGAGALDETYTRHLRHCGYRI